MFMLYILLVQCTFGFKILVYNTRFAYAHTKFMGAISDALVDAGLDVTVLLNDLDDRHEHNGTKKAKIVYVPPCEEAAASIRRQTDHEFCKAIWGTSATNPLIMLSLKTVMEEFSFPQCEYLMSRDDILERLKEEKFDVGITEVFDSCGLGLFEALGIKSTVVGSSMSLFESISTAIGAPLFPSFVPGTYAQGTDTMSFWGRLENLIHVFVSWEFSRYFDNAQHKVFAKKYGASFPSMKELTFRSQLVFTNSLPYFDFPRVTLKKILDIGGITYENPNNLDQEWLDILGKGSAILVSFGSVAKTIHMPETYKVSIIEAIRKFPNVTFIWKHEDPIDRRLLAVKNIVAKEWIPQNNLLGHPNVSGFITHGGVNSVLEAVFQGKPIITIPIFADQTRMGNQAQERGIGILLKKEQLTDVEALSNSIHRLLYSEQMKTACQRFLRLQSAAPHNPKKLLSDHVKLLAEFKTLEELQPKSAQLNLFVLYSLDIIFFLLCLLAISLLVILLVLRRLLNYLVFVLRIKKKPE